MALHIRKDGTILCAAMHPAVASDRGYLDDGLHYKLSVELGAVVTEPMHSTEGRGGHAKHGEWWWCDEVPDDVVVERRGRAA